MKNKITAILVDDEESSRIVLKSLLSKNFSEVDIVGEADNVDKAYKLVERTNPNLVFLDIQMPKASGFTLLKKYEEVPFEVIFVTSFDKYAINAIKFSALDYLLKPVETADLKTAVQKAIRHIEKKENSIKQIINLVHSFDQTYKERKIAVHAGEKVKMLNENDIICIEADGRYCKILTNGDESYATARYLKDFEDYLSANDSFLRISQSLIINVKYIKEYSKGEPCFIKMLNDSTFEVPRRKKHEVIEKLKK